jgi:hypothetical protein
MRLFPLCAAGLAALAGLCWAPAASAEGARLSIREMALSEARGSWTGKPAWTVGERVHVRVLLEGLRRDAAGQVRVRQSLELRDEAGRLLLEARDLLTLERAVPGQLSSIELDNHFFVPDGLAPGTYLVRVLCEDDVAGARTSRDAPFTVGEGRWPGLAITRFTLSPRGSDDAGSLGTVAVANARLVGYRTDAEGRYWIEADVVLIDPSGQIALRWDRVLEQQQRSEPMGLPLKLQVRLELPGHYEPGDYRLELRVRDRLAEGEVVRSATWTKR